MEVYFDDKKFLIITGGTTVLLNLTNEHEIECIIRQNVYLVKQRIKDEIEQLLSKHIHGTIFMKREISHTNLLLASHKD